MAALLDVSSYFLVFQLRDMLVDEAPPAPRVGIRSGGPVAAQPAMAMATAASPPIFVKAAACFASHARLGCQPQFSFSTPPPFAPQPRPPSSPVKTDGAATWGPSRGSPARAPLSSLFSAFAAKGEKAKGKNATDYGGELQSFPPTPTPTQTHRPSEPPKPPAIVLHSQFVFSQKVEGLLGKRGTIGIGALGRRVKLRWFVLRDHLLCYFKSELSSRRGDGPMRNRVMDLHGRLVRVVSLEALELEIAPAPTAKPKPQPVSAAAPAQSKHNRVGEVKDGESEGKDGARGSSLLDSLLAVPAESSPERLRQLATRSPGAQARSLARVVTADHPLARSPSPTATAAAATRETKSEKDENENEDTDSQSDDDSQAAVPAFAASPPTPASPPVASAKSAGVGVSLRSKRSAEPISDRSAERRYRLFASDLPSFLLWFGALKTAASKPCQS